MATQIFVNLPVEDLGRSVAFFTRLGYTFDPRFTDENATCMIVGENILARSRQNGSDHRVRSERPAVLAQCLRRRFRTGGGVAPM